MEGNHKKDIDGVFAKTMVFVMLCILTIATIAYISQTRNQDEAQPQEEVSVREAYWEQLQLDSLRDSIHFYEDGF